jgi:hypothetical protein
MNIVSAFIQDLLDYSSTHWSLVVSLLIMFFARASVYAVIPAPTLIQSLGFGSAPSDQLTLEFFSFFFAGIILFLLFTGIFELIFTLTHLGKGKQK